MGYEIGSHSNMHQLAYEMNQKEFDEDLKKSIVEIENLIGKKVEYYRAPGFSIKESNLWTLESDLHWFQGHEIEKICSKKYFRNKYF